MDSSELEYKYDLIKLHKRRLEKLDMQKARMGISTPSEILTEREDIIKEIHNIESELKNIDDLESLISQEVSDEKFSGMFKFFDKNLMSQVYKLVELIQSNAKLQANIDILNDLLIYIENSGNETNKKEIFPFIQRKIEDIMRFGQFHQCYYVLARSLYMIGEYRQCSEYSERSIKLEKRSEYFHLNADAIYELAKYNIEESEKDRARYFLEHEQETYDRKEYIKYIVQLRSDYSNEQSNVIRAINNWEEASALGFSGRDFRSLGKNIRDLRNKISAHIEELEDIEKQERELEKQEQRERDESVERERQQMVEKEEEEVLEAEERDQQRA